MLDDIAPAYTDVIIWDMKKNRESGRVSIRGTNLGLDPFQTFLWTPDSKDLFFSDDGGIIPYWYYMDAVSGKVVRKVPALASAPRFNSSGRRLLRYVKNAIRIYDTKTWSYFDDPCQNVWVHSFDWLSDTRIFVVGNWVGGRFRTTKDVNGKTVKNMDTVACVLDLFGNLPLRMFLLCSKPAASFMPWIDASPLLLDAQKDKAVLGFGNLLDLKKMQVHIYVHQNDMKNPLYCLANNVANIAYSPDGKYIFLKQTNIHEAAHNVILDADTGKPLLWYRGGAAGISCSPDNHVAIGWGKSVRIYQLRP